MYGILGEIRVFSGSYAPKNWAYCDGRSLNIKDYDPLYRVIGTTYGGDGKTSFSLPDFKGRIAIGSGQGKGLTKRVLGERIGTQDVTLTTEQMPSHNHALYASTEKANTNELENMVLASPQDPKEGKDVVYYLPDDPSHETLLHFKNNALMTAGAGNAHNNMQPFIGINYIICVNGYPPKFP